MGDFYKLCWSFSPEPPNFPLNLYNYNVEIDPNFIIQFPEGGGWNFGGRRMGDGGPWCAAHNCINFWFITHDNEALKS